MVGTLRDEVDPMISFMEVQEAPFQSHADIGALDAQIQEIEETVQLPLTHPELEYWDQASNIWGTWNRENSTSKGL